MSENTAIIERLRNQIKYIVFDLDGTLLTDDKIIPSDSVSIISNLQNKGIGIIVASGRHAREVFDILSRNGISGVDYIICRDGQHIYGKGAEKIFNFSYFCLKDLETLFSLTAMNNFFCSNEERDYLLFRRSLHAIKYFVKNRNVLKTNNLQVISLLLVKISHIKIGKVIFIDDSGVDLQKVNNYFTVHQMASGMLDVFPRGVNKVNALRWLTEKIGVNLNEFLYFGDDYNDWECFTNLTNVIVMGNAPEELKQFSLIKDVPSNNNSGVANTLKIIFN